MSPRPSSPGRRAAALRGGGLLHVLLLVGLFARRSGLGILFGELVRLPPLHPAGDGRRGSCNDRRARNSTQ